MSEITISAFRWVPPFVQGLVRDLRVRWALEEAGIPYTAHLIGPQDQASPSYRELQPFGQVPTFEEDGLRLFESGAIVMHIAERSAALMPADADAQARTRTWMFAALNSVEPPIDQLADIDLFNQGAEWTRERRPRVEEAVRKRLADLAAWLDDREYLDRRFTAADLLMSTVLRTLRQTDLVSQYPVVNAYHARCEARPAFKKAYADHMAPFAEGGAST